MDRVNYSTIKGYKCLIRGWYCPRCGGANKTFVSDNSKGVDLPGRCSRCFKNSILVKKVDNVHMT